MRLSFVTLALALAALLASGAQPAYAAVKIQAPNVTGNARRAAAIKASFRSSFEDYLKYARGSDALLPLSKKGTDGFGGWGATFIDALSTAKVMGFDDLFQQGIAFAEKVNFDMTGQATISIFETTIRYVASLLSVYELDGKRNKKLVQQAVKLGDHLLKGWVGNNDLPFNTLDSWNTFGPPANQDRGAIIAETGTLIIEFDRLSKFSGDPKYRDFAKRAMLGTIYSTQTLPKGLYGQGIDPATKKATDDYATYGGGSDSFYEYLIKYGQLRGSVKDYIPAWVDNVKATVKYMLTTAGGDTKTKWTYLGDYSPSSGGLIPRFSHLGCFVGGNWILGGKLLRSDAIFQYGLKLAAACINTYTSSASGVGPESFVFKDARGSTNGVTIKDEAFYKKSGFNYDADVYILRPEVVESVFYAYRTTGDKKWQDLAWQAFTSIRRVCKAPAALAAIQPVSVAKPQLLDDSESFLYAELYKYLYLAQTDGSVLPLEKYVFNTEAHPFLVDNPKADYSAIKVGAIPKPLSAQPSASRVAGEPEQAEPTPTAAEGTTTAPLPRFSNLPEAAQSIIDNIQHSITTLVGRAKRGHAEGVARHKRRATPRNF